MLYKALHSLRKISKTQRWTCPSPSFTFSKAFYVSISEKVELKNVWTFIVRLEGYVGALHEPALHRHAGLKDQKPNIKKTEKYNEALKKHKNPKLVNSDGHDGRVRKKFMTKCFRFLIEELSNYSSEKQFHNYTSNCQMLVKLIY